jgi:hypothetical protein
MGLLILFGCIVGWMICLGLAGTRYPICDNAPIKYWIIPGSLIAIAFMVLGYGIIQFFGAGAMDLIEKFVEQFCQCKDC